MFSVATILHPTDFSPSAEQAFQLAEALAAREHARLIVLHVLPPSGRAVISGKARVQLRKGGVPAEPLEALCRLGSRDPNVSIEHRLAEGNVVVEILRVAQETQADVIVMGSRGRTGLARLALGSVADQVLCQARCTVVTVSAPETLRTAPVGRAAFAGASGYGAGSPTKAAGDRGIHDERTRAFSPDGAIAVKTLEPIGKANP